MGAQCFVEVCNDPVQMKALKKLILIYSSCRHGVPSKNNEGSAEAAKLSTVALDKSLHPTYMQENELNLNDVQS